MVADHGWALLPDYRFDPASGLWRHRAGPVEPPLRLAHCRYDADGVLRYPRPRDRARSRRWPSYLADARALFAALPDRPTDAARSGLRRLRAAALVRPAGRLPGAHLTDITPREDGDPSAPQRVRTLITLDSAEVETGDDFTLKR